MRSKMRMNKAPAIVPSAAEMAVHQAATCSTVNRVASLAGNGWIEMLMRRNWPRNSSHQTRINQLPRCVFHSRDPLGNQAEGKIIVGHLRLDRVHAVDGFVEITEMVVAEA